VYRLVEIRLSFAKAGDIIERQGHAAKRMLTEKTDFKRTARG
jgi:hypothetical protein